MGKHEIAAKHGTKIVADDEGGTEGTEALPADKAKRLAAELSAAGFPAVTERGPLPMLLYVTLAT